MDDGQWTVGTIYIYLSLSVGREGGNNTCIVTAQTMMDGKLDYLRGRFPGYMDSQSNTPLSQCRGECGLKNLVPRFYRLF